MICKGLNIEVTCDFSTTLEATMIQYLQISKEQSILNSEFCPCQTVSQM